jgi:replicative DNA helicase Mcm
MVEGQITNVAERFQSFLGSFKTSTDETKYSERFDEIVRTGSYSLTVDFEDLMIADRALAESILEKPDEYLQHLDEGALSQFRIYSASEITPEHLRVRLRGLPAKTPLRLMGSKQIGKLISVEGMLVRSSSIQPQTKHSSTMSYLYFSK